jgi:phosphoadenosine phosphosulfate reductase
MSTKSLELAAEEIKELNARFENASAEQIVEWAVDRFSPDIALACSFGAEDVALVEMVAKVDPQTRIFYLDTDLLFAETYGVRDRLVEKYGVGFVPYKSAWTLAEQAQNHGDQLYSRDPNLCCQIRKIEPLKNALSDLSAWITGIRRDQAPTRANAGFIEADEKFGLIKFNPLARWTSEDVWAYIGKHGVPFNPLHNQGYPSIGCTPCTRQVQPGEDPRAGRWAGFAKKECGLHA